MEIRTPAGTFGDMVTPCQLSQSMRKRGTLMRFWVHRELPEHPLLCSTSFPGATPCGESHTCFSLCGSLPEGSYVSYNVTKWKGSSSAGRGLPGWSSAPGPCLSYVDLVTQCGCSPTLAHWCGFTTGRCEQNILSWLPGAWSPQVPLCHGLHWPCGEPRE